MEQSYSGLYEQEYFEWICDDYSNIHNSSDHGSIETFGVLNIMKFMYDSICQIILIAFEDDLNTDYFLL